MTLVLIWATAAPARESLSTALAKDGREIIEVDRFEAALATLRERSVELLVMDLPPDSLRSLRQLAADFPLLPILTVAAVEGSAEAIEVVQAGAFDFLPTPFVAAELGELAEEALASASHGAEFEVGQRESEAGSLVGSSRAMGKLYRDVAKLSATPVTVLIRGETGTGKELVARALWKHGHRAHCPLVVVNCAAIPENLLESELFGYEKGAFTGANTARKGKFEQARGGTIFLDEIGDMSLPLQAKMLRVLQEKRIERVGGQGEVDIDVRVLAATHQPLEQMVEKGSFRSDLLYRLQTAGVTLPPLRDRLGDVARLVTHFLALFSEEVGVQGKISREALSYLARQTWPGNVRQLQNVLRRALLKRRDLVIGREDIIEVLKPQQEGQGMGLREFAKRSLEEAEQLGQGNAFREVVSLAEQTVIREALERSGGNQSKAARWLGITRLTLREKLK